MALVVTSLNGAVALNARQLRLTAFTNPSQGGISAGTLLLVDGEWMKVTDASLSPVLSVTRGALGSAACPHNTLAPVTYGLSSDFTQQIGTGAAPSYSYGADATVTNPVVDATIYIDKATAIALTLGDPNKDQTNTVRWVSLTAAAHLITYATGFYGNAGTSDVATFPATIGAGFTMVARNAQWCAVATADDGVTFA